MDPTSSKDGLAKAIGVTASTITRWSQGGSPAADAAIRTARAYGRSPLEALLAASLITQEESQGSWRGRTVEDLGVLELVRELERRVAADERTGEEIRAAASMSAIPGTPRDELEGASEYPEGSIAAQADAMTVDGDDMTVVTEERAER